MNHTCSIITFNFPGLAETKCLVKRRSLRTFENFLRFYGGLVLRVAQSTDLHLAAFCTRHGFFSSPTCPGWFAGYRGNFPPYYETVGGFNSPQPSSGIGLKDARSCTSLSQCVFMACETRQLRSETSLVAIRSACPMYSSGSLDVSEGM